ncbi:Uncharacterised protein [Escherichia coli]|nr:Uncharacterised protein [Escherichia coli]CAD6180868.1 Uncharacterised protein [Escherichia coli]
MLGGADNPNGELLSYIIGADTLPRCFFLPGNKKRVRRGVNVDISGTHPAFSSLWFSAPIIF